MKFNTKVIHGGQHHEKVTGAVMTPVFQTSTYAQVSPGQPVGDYEYSRVANPTRQALEDALASIENGSRGLIVIRLSLQIVCCVFFKAVMKSLPWMICMVERIDYLLDYIRIVASNFILLI